jgi:hypothetical protein
MKKLVPSARKAAKNAANLMTFDVRKNAIQNGWSEDVAYATEVVFKKDRYEVSVSAKLNNEALDLEYGTSRSRPTAAVRKFANNTTSSQNSIVKALEKELGWKL